MSSVVTLVIAALYASMMKNVYWAFLLLIFAVPFLPRYIGFGVGDEGFSLSLQRILILLLFVGVMLLIAQRNAKIYGHFASAYKIGRPLFLVILLFVFLKVFSLSLNSPLLSMYFSLFNDFLFSFFVFLSVVIFVRSEKAVNDVMKYLTYSYVTVLFLVTIESLVKAPLLSIFYSDAILAHRDMTAGFERDGQYRTVGGFSNPMPLGEYLVVLLPLVIAYVHKKKRILLFPLLVFTMYAIYTTGSRAALLMSILAMYLFVYIQIYKQGGNLRRFANVVNIFTSLAAVYLVYQFIGGMITNFTGEYQQYDIEDRSLYSRAFQYSHVFSVLMQSPVIGFGRVRNFTEAFDIKFAIDNHYFWTILEVGFLGIVIYFALYYLLIKNAYTNVKLKIEHSTPVFLGIVLITLYHFLVAIPDVHVYVYIYAGLLISTRMVYKKKVDSAFKYNVNNVMGTIITNGGFK